MIPNEPVILLGYVNMKLRDECCSLESFCKKYDCDMKEISERLNDIGYVYNASVNQFK